MICFQDRSFCSWSNGCANTKCVRNLTKELEAAARRWWGGDPPIAFSDFRAKDCGYHPIESELEKRP